MVSVAGYSEHRDLHLIQVVVQQPLDTQIALPRVAGHSLHSRGHSHPRQNSRAHQEKIHLLENGLKALKTAFERSKSSQAK